MKTNHPGIYMRKPEKEFHPIKDKSVYIIFHGKALGDTLAFFPYVEQFRIENRCRVKVYLPKQEMIQYFKPVYPEIEFLPEDKHIGEWSRGGGKNLYFRLPFDADNVQTFKVGIGWDGRQHQRMQKSISDILGMEFREGKDELKPRLAFKDHGRPMKEKYVAIGVHSNGPQMKYWNYPRGWEYVVKYLNHKGYKALAIDLQYSNNRGKWIQHKPGEPEKPKWVNQPPDNAELAHDNPLDVTMSNIKHSEFFIGLGSGLSWLSWALNKWVIMIHGFTKPWYEFQDKCVHVHNDKVCTGCWHVDYVLNLKEDWEMCPEHKGTDRHFECSKEIDPPMVFGAIDKVIKCL